MIENHYSAIDFALADFFLSRSGLSDEDHKDVHQLVLTISSEQAKGHSCIELTEADLALLTQCKLVSLASDIAAIPETPFVVEGDRLYFNRYWQYEARLVKNIYRRFSQSRSHSQGLVIGKTDLLL